MNAVVDRMTPNVTTMIRMDHSHVFALFHRYKASASSNRKQALVRSACLALQIHAQLEDEIFYPALRSVLSGDQVLEKSEPEHDEMRRLMSELREQSAGDASFDDKFMDLMSTVIHHVADEETRLLPAAERLLPGQLGSLGVRMTRRRMELLKPHAGEIAATTVRSFPAGTAVLAASAVALGAMLLSRGRSKTASRRWTP
ncbi:MAG: hemerythrin domain-containing protein [Steroidobacter sp.]